MSEPPPSNASAPADGLPRIAGYRIVRELGRGGMATVYLAEQESLGRQVALKILADRYAAEPDAAARFVREARTAARLMHRHIVAIYDVGTHQGRPYLAMEYLPGDTLTAQGMAPRQALEAVREIALALDHAHREGVVHRDVKPENILRRADGSYALADFGIAHTIDGTTVMTREGITLGTPHYMSPEQLQGKPLDGRADLYSLGVVLYQLLTGALPYQGTDGWSVGVQHISAPIPRLPPTLARYQPVIDALLAKDPAHRPQTGADAARLVEGALGNSDSVPTQWVGTLPARRRSRQLLGAAAGIVAVALAAWAWHSARMPSEGTAAAVANSAAAAPASSQRSIAVLPLANLSGNAANDYFSDGLAETMLETFAQVPDLKVIARSSSFAFKGQALDAREIGRRLGAAHLLEGSVQQAGDRLRVSVQLIRASDGAHLWADKYDRQVADVFAIQDEIAGKVVQALELVLPAAQQAERHAAETANVEAYQEYLRGNALLPERKAAGMRQALAHFERAIALDPGYARAYTAASTTLTLLDSYASTTPQERQRSRRYADKALALAPNLGEAHIALGAQYERDEELEKAEQAYRRGVALAPNFATGHQWLGEILFFQLGRIEDANREFDKAYALDPLSPVIRSMRMNTLAALGKMDAALADADALIAEGPKVARNYDARAGLYHQAGDLVGLLRDSATHARLDPEAYGFQSHLCQSLIEFGALPEARACTRRIEAKAPDAPDITQLRWSFALLDGRPQEALQIGEGMSAAGLWRRAVPLMHLGRPTDVVALYRSEAPELFGGPLSAFTFGRAGDAYLLGAALYATGEHARGRELLHHAVALRTHWPRSMPQGGRGWTDVQAYAAGGEIDKAIAALREGVAEGYFLRIVELDADPALADLRADPRYEATLAPARERAERERARARAAGLL